MQERQNHLAPIIVRLISIFTAYTKCILSPVSERDTRDQNWS